MGRGEDIDLDAFEKMYAADPLYSWVGFDSPLMYAAHKAAGGMTSIYRQLGIGCERLWRQVIIDQMGITPEDAEWSYRTPTAAGRTKTLKLDGRIALADVGDRAARDRVGDWLERATAALEIQVAIAGVVFEVRQGYKSKDSKRQNADIDNASHALKSSYIPATTIMSLQMDADIQLRYRQNNWIVLVGDQSSGDDLQSCYAFARGVLDYDLPGFFERNTDRIRSEVDDILQLLLMPA